MEEEMPLTDIGRDLIICRKALSGEMNIYDASQAIFANHSHGGQWNEDPWDADIPETETLGNLIDEIEREVPQGLARQYWNPEAVARRDKLKVQIEEKYRAEAMRAFQAIINIWQPWLDSMPRNRR